VGTGKGLNRKLKRERERQRGGEGGSVIMVGKCEKQRAFNADMFVLTGRVNEELMGCKGFAFIMPYHHS